MASETSETDAEDPDHKKNKVQFQDWSIAVCFRNTRNTDSVQLRCSAAMTCSPIAHCEVLFKRKCGDNPAKGKKCKYDGPHHKVGEYTDAHGDSIQTHWVMYGIRDNKDDNTLTCTVDGGFPAYNGWTFIALQATKGQVNAAEKFARSQLGRPYNNPATWWNFTLGQAINTPWWYGTRLSELKACKVWSKAQNKFVEKPPIPVTDRKWFCSEFTAATLAYANLWNSRSIDPCFCQPKHVREVLLGDGRHYEILERDVCSMTDEELVKANAESKNETNTAASAASSPPLLPSSSVAAVSASGATAAASHAKTYLQKAPYKYKFTTAATSGDEDSDAVEANKQLIQKKGSSVAASSVASAAIATGVASSSSASSVMRRS